MSDMVEITVSDGDAAWVFTCERRPRYWKSWAMRQLPYGTAFAGPLRFTIRT